MHDDNGFGSGKYPGELNGPEPKPTAGQVVLTILGVLVFFLVAALAIGW